MVHRRFTHRTRSVVRRTVAAVAVLLTVTLTGPPPAAHAAAGMITGYPLGGAGVSIEAARLTVIAAGNDDDPVPVPTPAPTTPSDNSNVGGTGGDNLPRTGNNVFALLVFSILLVAAGVAVRLTARDRPRTESQGTL